MSEREERDWRGGGWVDDIYEADAATDKVPTKTRTSVWRGERILQVRRLETLGLGDLPANLAS